MATRKNFHSEIYPGDESSLFGGDILVDFLKWKVMMNLL
jgi:hypothetical protein